MTANTTFFVAQRGVGPPRRPSTRCCGDSRVPGTPVRDNISLKWAAIWVDWKPRLVSYELKGDHMNTIEIAKM
jgi:hypothetical protein